MIEVRGLTKTYGAERAVDTISFEVQQGEVLGFLGPNAAAAITYRLRANRLDAYFPDPESLVK